VSVVMLLHVWRVAPPYLSLWHEHKHQIGNKPISWVQDIQVASTPESPFATAAGTSRNSADGRQLRHTSSICMPSLEHNNGPTHPSQLSKDDIMTTHFLEFWERSHTTTVGSPNVVTHVSQTLPCFSRRD